MRCARVAESVDARDLKSLAFRGVPVQVWPRAPFNTKVLNHKVAPKGVFLYLNATIQWRVSKAVMHWIANPCSSVRLRDTPPFQKNF